MFGVKFFRRRRAVQNHRFQIVRRRGLELLHKFVELMIDQSLLPRARFSPAPARAAASERSSAEAPESATTAPASPRTASTTPDQPPPPYHGPPPHDPRPRREPNHSAEKEIQNEPRHGRKDENR